MEAESEPVTISTVLSLSLSLLDGERKGERWQIMIHPIER
jgi:hypothetical protein